MKLSTAIEGRDGAQEIETLIREDWDFISTVTGLTCGHSKIRAPTGDWSLVTETENKFDQMIQLTSQMQQVITGQQQQQISIGQLNSSKTASVRLPILEIPTFSGDRLKWTEFWDTFEASVDTNTNISDIEKLNYLLSKLSEEAKHSVSGILLSNENYNVVVDLLKERYGDSQTNKLTLCVDQFKISSKHP